MRRGSWRGSGCYLNRPELTAERFIVDPFSSKPGSRICPGQAILPAIEPTAASSYLGRADDQVKVRGYRIELGEIESALLDLAGVAQAAASFQTNDNQEQRIVAYVVPKADDKGPRSARHRRFQSRDELRAAPFIRALEKPGWAPARLHDAVSFHSPRQTALDPQWQSRSARPPRTCKSGRGLPSPARALRRRSSARFSLRSLSSSG